VASPSEIHHDDLREAPGELGARFAAFDWASTSLGPIADWPQSLRTAVGICLTSRFPLLIWWGPEHVMIYNDGYRPMLGRTKHPSALGAPGKEVWPEIWEIIGPMLDGVLSTGVATWSYDQMLVLDRNGYPEECYFTFSYSPITAESGDVGGIFTAVTETTDQVLTERRLGTLSLLSRRLAGAANPDQVRQITGDVLRSNPNDHPVALMLDVRTTKEELERMPLSTELHDDVLAVVAEAALLRRITQRDLPARPVEVHGAEPPVAALHALPIMLPTDDDVSEVLVVGRSARRLWDTALATYLALTVTHVATALSGIRLLEHERQRAESLAALDETKSTFFTNISHELRTPLTLIAAPLAEALASGDLPTEQRERLEMVERNTARLSRLVDAILDFGRMAASKLIPHLEPIDVTLLTKVIAESFSVAFRQAGLEFVVECEQADRPAHLDRDMFERILLNLLTNALKYTPSGTVTLSLHVGLESFRVSVTDTGVGIRKRDRDRIFERFEQLPRSRRARSQQGAGIGLAMVKQLTELMGGSVQVESIFGRGSTFTVQLPWGEPQSEAPTGRSITPRRVNDFLAETQEWNLPYAAEGGPTDTQPQAVAEVESEAATSLPGEAASQRPRLLIAEDNTDMRVFLQRSLSTHYSVEAVPDGLAAMERLRVARPDIVLADAMMPQLDGFALTKAIRDDPALQDLPIIILSARAGDSETEQGLASGADDYVAKPFSMPELRARLASNLARSRDRLRDAAWRRTVMESLHDPLVIIGSDGVVVEVNEAFTEVLGYTMADGPFAPPYPWSPSVEQRLSDTASGEQHVKEEEGPDVGQHPGAGEREHRLIAKDGGEVWVQVESHRIEPTGDQPGYTVLGLRDVTREHAARARRLAAAELSAGFSAADDLDQVLEAAVSGFADLFDGDSTVRAMAGPEEHVFTVAGPVLGTDLDPSLWHLLTTPEPDAAAPTEPVQGLLVSPHHNSSSECRVWVQFHRPRIVTTDERIVGDLLGQAFSLAVDRVVAATTFADRESHLAKAIESHRLIGQAIGILIERHRITPAQAFAKLKDASQDRNIKLREIAARVIETGAEPGDAD